MRSLPWMALVAAMGCGLLFANCSPSPPGMKEQRVAVDSGVLQSYQELFALDHERLGFPLLPVDGEVRILTVDREHWKVEYPPPNYDVSFQFYTGTSFYPYSSRFIALKNPGGRVVSQTMSFNGPLQYELDGQTIHESISIVNEADPGAAAGPQPDRTMITYQGPDERFVRKRASKTVEGLKPSEVGPVLREWGYSYTADKFQ